MKKYLFFLAALAATASCSKAAPETQENVERVNVKFSISGSEENLFTKSTSEATTEGLVNSAIVFVFNSDGNLDIMGFSDGTSINASVCCGKDKKIYAVVNPLEDLTGVIAKESDLEDYYASNLVTGTGTDFFEMSGMVGPMEIKSTTSSVTIPVKRLASKICINSISNNLNPALGKITIQDMFLSNVTATSGWFAPCTDGEWMHKRGLNLNSYLWMHEGSLSTEIECGNDLEEAHCFYCYPNDTVEDSTSSEWCARHTRLVIKALVNGITCYYVISLNKFISNHKLESNYCYTIRNLAIHHLGSSDPDIPTEPSSLDFELSITPWTTEYINSVTL